MRPTPFGSALERYCDFFAGSCVDEEEPLGELLPDAPELGGVLLAPELLGEALLPDVPPEVPPLAEPELESLELGELALGDDELAPLELGELALGDEELAPLELGELALGDEELAPPEAEPEPDFEASLEPDPAAELDDDPGLVGDDEAPLDGDELGEEAVLELDEPGLDDVLLESPPRSHAESPNARATAAARIESFMCPPLGWGVKRRANGQKSRYRNRRASSAPGLTR